MGVGTARSGTGWWDGLVSQHPRVFRNVGAPREMHFFDGLWAGGLRAADIDRYHALFARPAGTISGEWTPGYMLDIWTPGC